MEFFEIFGRAWPGGLSGLMGIIDAFHGTGCYRKMGKGAGPC